MLLRVIRLYRAPFSTNVERVALALAHKGLAVESVLIDYADRSPVEAVSGQRLVPVIDDAGTIVSDSHAILRHLEETRPTPPLFPGDPAARGRVDVFLEWFDRVWKIAPNAIEAESDEAAIAAHGETMNRHLDLFERLLTGSEHLLGDEFGPADCVAFPFLKYAAGREPADDEEFHRILDEYQTIEGRPRLADWIARVDERPRSY